MAIPSRFTKVKIAAGYTLLLVVLLLSLLFVHREMEKLSDTDDVQSLQTDSLLLLLKEKDENTIRMLQIINEANESMITPVELDSIIAEQDTVITQQRVQHRIITKRDSVITKRKKKGFFRRLGEVFAPSKEDTAVLVNTAVEFATDTILEPYNPIDSLHQRIRTVTKRIRTARTSEPFNSYDWRDCHCRRVAVRLLPDYDLAGYHPEQSLPEGIGGGQ